MPEVGLMISDRSAAELAAILDDLVAEKGRNHKGVEEGDDGYVLEDPHYFETMSYDPQHGWVYDYSCIMGGIFTKLLEPEDMNYIYDNENFSGIGAVVNKLPERFQTDLFQALFLDLQTKNDGGEQWGEIVDEAKYNLSQIEPEKAGTSV